MKAIFVFLGFLALTQAAVSVKDIDVLSNLKFRDVDVQTVASIKADASAYFDQVLANLREEMEVLGLDNVVLPNATIGFEKEILGIIWHGEAGLYNGLLNGMHTIHRTGVAELSYDSGNGDILMQAEVGVNQASLGYSMTVKFMDLGPRATVTGKLTRVRLLLGLRVRSDFTVVMEKFDVRDTGFLTVEVSGLGIILNFLVEIVSSFLGNLLKRFVIELLEGTIRNIINAILSAILFPPDVFQSFQAIQHIISAAASYYIV